LPSWRIPSRVKPFSLSNLSFQPWLCLPSGNDPYFRENTQGLLRPSEGQDWPLFSQELWKGHSCMRSSRPNIPQPKAPKGTVP
jgi:hypothetical protein